MTMQNITLYDTFHDQFPRTILCRISGYGQNGPSYLDPGIDRLKKNAICCILLYSLCNDTKMYVLYDIGHDLNYCARAGVLGAMETITQ